MASITIHAIPPELEGRLNEESGRRQISKNALVKELLGKALSLGPSRGKEYEEFLGVWSDDETASFKQRLAEADVIDREEW
ncbi:MAG: hypothetical protein M0001_15375 [Treponema sp.]|nr:hypothetical protein [Treponema sp.]